MGIFDKFKSKKDKPATGKSEKKSGASKENVLDLVKEEPQAAQNVKEQILKESTGEAFRYLLRARLSEKSNMLAALNKYVFIVHPKANKTEVKKAVERVYDVHVRSVNIVRIQGKSRRYGWTQGRTKNWKKAVVTVAPGEKIEGMTDTV